MGEQKGRAEKNRAEKKTEQTKKNGGLGQNPIPPEPKPKAGQKKTGTGKKNRAEKKNGGLGQNPIHFYNTWVCEIFEGGRSYRTLEQVLAGKKRGLGRKAIPLKLPKVTRKNSKVNCYHPTEHMGEIS